VGVSPLPFFIDMKTIDNTYIDKDRNLHIDIELGNEGDGIIVESLFVYSNKSFLDNGYWVFSHEFGENERGRKVVLQYSEGELNTFHMTDQSGLYPYSIDLHNNLVIIQVQIEYTTEYHASHTCSQAPDSLTFAVYYPCKVYNGILPSLKELEDDCNIPVNLINGLLRKKAIDTCIRSGHFDQACRYWEKFYNKCTGSFQAIPNVQSTTTQTQKGRGGCNCNG